MPIDVRNKIVVVPGDLHKPRLGMSEADREHITEEVNFVVHSAASISFFEHIHTLLEQNYEVRMQCPACSLTPVASPSCLQAAPNSSISFIAHWPKITRTISENGISGIGGASAV